MQCSGCTIAQVWLNEDDLKHILDWAGRASKAQALTSAEAQTFYNLQSTFETKFGAACPVRP